MASASRLPRRVEPELLDELPATDARAQRSRRDLRRIHRTMATLSILQRALDGAVAETSPPASILELGAGDGSLMLRLAQARAMHWTRVALTLLDRVDTVDEDTRGEFRTLGWQPKVVLADAPQWLQAGDAPPWDLVVATLFLHHFQTDALAGMLQGIAARSRIFFCFEPRRSTLALAGSHLVALLGAGAVTREDAVLSVHAGFRGQELTTLWPDHDNWRLREYPAGLFGHAFLAVRRSPAS